MIRAVLLRAAVYMIKWSGAAIRRAETLILKRGSLRLYDQQHLCRKPLAVFSPIFKLVN